MKKLISFLLSASAVFGCSKPDSNDPSGSGNSSAGDNVQVTFTRAEDGGDLLLEWEKVDIDSDKTKNMYLILSDGEKAIYGKFSSDANAGNKYRAYSGMAVYPHGDAHYADFQSVDHYSLAELAKARYCFTVSGATRITEDTKNGKHVCRVEMPASFAQVADNDPSFLRDAMRMYSVDEYKGEETTLSINQIPSVFVFNVTNTTSRTMAFQEVYMNVESKENVASQSLDLTFDWKNGQADLSYDATGYEMISVSAGEGVTLSKGQKYTAYALALPLADNDAFKGKVVNVSVKCGDFEYVALQLDGDRIAEMNGFDTYNWVGGKTYSIDVVLDKELEASGKVMAGNMLELSSNFLWTYTLKYENANGQILPDYESICTLPVERLTYYNGYISQNIAPLEAETIGIYDADDTRLAGFQTETLRPSYTDTPLYSFGLLSDVHIGKSSSYKADSDFENALKFFNEQNVEMTCICGDITQNNKESEYAKYAEITAKANAPVYTTTGNHDCTGDTGVNVEWWTKYTGQPLVFEKTIERNGKTDHFLFFGMSYYNFTSAYLEENFVWLEEKLEEYRNERCFVITHMFFPDRAGNLKDIYPSGNWLKGEQLARMKGLCDRYVNTLWLSGHSHWKWSLQEYQDRANIYRNYSGNQATSGWCVHVSSCAEPITSDGTSRESVPEGSEGAIVHVYENYVEILGMDLLNRKYIPIATYRLDTSLQDVAAKTPAEEGPDAAHYITATNFSHNTNKNKGATVADVEGMPNYVDVTFTGQKQGFHIYNSTYSSAATGAKITIEDIQAFSNGVAVDLPEGVGFYGKSYFLTSTTSALVYTSESYPGVHFHTSSSYAGPLPLTIRMKVQLEFY